MKRKYFALIATTGLLALPLLTYANISTYNFTDEDSSVKVTSGSIKPCSSDAGVYTPKRQPSGEPGSSTVTDFQIKGLCFTSKDHICTADIYNSSNCRRDKIATASLNMKTSKIIDLKPLDPRYKFEVVNDGSTLNLRYNI